MYHLRATLHPTKRGNKMETLKIQKDFLHLYVKHIYLTSMGGSITNLALSQLSARM